MGWVQPSCIPIPIPILSFILILSRSHSYLLSHALALPHILLPYPVLLLLRGTVCDDRKVQSHQFLYDARFRRKERLHVAVSSSKKN